MKVDKKTLDTLIGLVESHIGEDGLEYPDPTPKFAHVGPKRLSLEDQVERVLGRRLRELAIEQEFETLEEAEDFDIEDEDPLPLSGHEITEMIDEIPPVAPSEPEVKSDVEEVTPVDVSRDPAESPEESTT